MSRIFELVELLREPVQVVNLLGMLLALDKGSPGVPVGGNGNDGLWLPIVLHHLIAYRFHAGGDFVMFQGDHRAAVPREDCKHLPKRRPQENRQDTVERCVSFFEGAFLLQEAKRYNLKGRREIGSLKKHYFSDAGLRNARLNFAYPDEGQVLENVVYNSLIYEGYTVNVGRFDTVEKNQAGASVRKTNEVDFYPQKGPRKYYVRSRTASRRQGRGIGRFAPS